ncbi:MAG: multidrug ABC transporter ATP-binding protein [Treponema sp.]|nr:MAG: multidrug ABC transporter ATP-binding protein [Treponema sp.]
MKAFKRILPFIKENKWSYFTGILFLMIIDFVQLYIPEIIQNITNDYQGGILTRQKILIYCGLVILIGLVMVISRFIWRYCIFTPALKLEYKLRKDLFSKLLTLSPNYFVHHKTGNLMAHVTNDVNAIRTAWGQAIVMAVDATFMMIFVIIKMFLSTNLRLTALALSVVPLLIIFVTFFGKLVHKYFKKTQAAFADLSDTVQESFSGIRVIKSFAQEEEYKTKFYNINKNNYNKNLDMIKIKAIFKPAMILVGAISFLIVLYFGGIAVIDGEIRLGNFIAFNMYMQMMFWPIQAFGMVVNILQRGAASMERLNKIFDEKPEIIDPYPDATQKKIANIIEFKNVSFKYPNTEKFALKNISFTAAQNKSLAIIGNTGAGKSTIVNLILRLYDLNETDSGEIIIDNSLIKDVSITNLRESVALVPQDSFLFSQTINDNIAFAYETQQKAECKNVRYDYLNNGEDFSKELLDKIETVSKLSDLHKNIVDFPEGYNTVLGERGITLSGGQKQRMSIARAIFKDPQMLILDDSFSAVDTETEEKILQNLKKYNQGAGMIIISHRISTVKNCDEIIVLSDGEIVERGNDTTLMKNKGVYYKMAMRQRLEKQINRG